MYHKGFANPEVSDTEGVDQNNPDRSDCTPSRFLTLSGSEAQMFICLGREVCLRSTEDRQHHLPSEARLCSESIEGSSVLDEGHLEHRIE